MKKFYSSLLALFLIITPFVVNVQSVSAQEGDNKLSTPVAGNKGLLSGVSDQCFTLGEPPTINGVPVQGDCSLCDVVTIVDSAIKLMLGIVGSIALIIVVVAGFQFMGIGTLAGEGASESIATGKKTLVNAAIGLALVFLSYTLVNFGLNIILGQEINGTAQLFGNQEWSTFCE